MELFNQRFVHYALVAGLMAGGLCAYLGVYMILRRIVLLGIALSEVSALGVAAGLMIGVDPSAASLVVTTAAIIFYWFLFRSRTITQESVIGCTYVLAAALAVILVAKNPFVESRGLDLVSGNLLYAGPADIAMLGAVGAVVVATHFALRRNLLFTSFDGETARAFGINADAYDFVIYLTIGAVIATAMKVTGMLFAFGSLVVPPLTGLVVLRRMRFIPLLAVAVSCLSTVSGIIVSIVYDLPTAPAAMAVACVILAIAALASALVRARR
jgi:ABC-type Mn2+/Zn2+ transport system permease subunit